jgi:hypothetical protein
VVFILVLTIPSFAWLLEKERHLRVRRVLLVAVVLATIVQGGLFRVRYDAAVADPKRRHIFDSEYASRILPAALSLDPRPIELDDEPGIPGYIQAYWYATLQGVPLSNFEQLGVGASPAAGSAVITTRDVCPYCRVVAEEPPYVVYIAGEEDRARTPLPEGAFRAEVTLDDAPLSMRPGGRATLRVLIKNVGDSVWPGRTWESDSFQVGIGNHWLNADGIELTHDDGRAPLEADLPPGDSRLVELTVNAPKEPGDYLLEVDMLQEGVSWFALKGSRTARVRVRVEAGWFDW